MLFEGRKVSVGEEHEASAPRRVGAWAVDALIAGLLSLALLKELLIAQSPEVAVVHLVDVPLWWVLPVAIVVWTTYRGLTERGGGSVGKRLFHVHVHHDEGELGFLRAASRALTAPFDAVLGHLEREGPFDQRRKVRVVKRPAEGVRRWAAPVGWIALALGCGLWLALTPTSLLVRELHWVQLQNRCGEVPREVIRFTDRDHKKFTWRCDDVVRALLDRARSGDPLADETVSSLRFAGDWGKLPPRQMATNDSP